MSACAPPLPPHLRREPPDRPADDEHDLTAHRPFPIIREEVRDRSSLDVLELFGHFAGHDGRAESATEALELGEGVGEAVGRFVHHHRMGRVDDLVERRTPVAPRPREKSEEEKPVRLETGRDERGERGRRPGDWHDGHARIDRRANEPGAGVGYQRCPRVGHQRKRLALE